MSPAAPSTWGQEQICPHAGVRRRCPDGKVPAESVTPEPGPCLHHSPAASPLHATGTPAWSRQGQAGFSLPFHKVTDQIQRDAGPGAVPCSVLSCAGRCQTRGTRWPQSHRNPLPQPRGTRSCFARSPGSPLCRTVQDPFPDERFLLPSATRAAPPCHCHLGRMPEEHAAAGAARSRADPLTPCPARAGSDPSTAWVPMRTPAGCWVLPTTSSSAPGAL